MQTIAFALGGERYRVTCEREADARLIAFWSARMQDHGGGPVTEVVLRTTPDGGLVEIDGALELRQTSVEDLWPALEGWLYQRLMASQLGQRLVVHAACLAFRGGAWLFSGESGAGKSVLSARLSQRGWTYLTDEFALLDATERVWPVPRPISFRADELPAPLWRELRGKRVSGEHQFQGLLGDTIRMRYLQPDETPLAFEPWPLRGVFLLGRRPGAAPRLARLTGPRLRAWLFSLRQRR